MSILAGARAKWEYLKNHDGFAAQPFHVVLRLFLWALRCLLRLPAQVSLQKWGVQLYLPPQWRGTAKVIFLFREHYERELGLLKRFLRPGDTLIDVGANFGVYTLAGASAVGPTGRVIAFEPAQDTFKVLQRNVGLNSFTCVYPLPLAATDQEGELKLFHHPDSSRHSLGPYQGQTTHEIIRTTTIDKVLSDMALDHVQVIKADVEGAEEIVLRGAERLFSRCTPAVILESNPHRAGEMGLSPHGAWDFLSERGYQFFALARGGELVPVYTPPRGGNIIAIKNG